MAMSQQDPCGRCCRGRQLGPNGRLVAIDAAPGALGRRRRLLDSEGAEQATAVLATGPELASWLLALRDALDPSGLLLCCLVRGYMA